MKILLIALLLTCAFCFSASGQAKTPEQAAKDFYRWYLTELNADRYPIRQSKPRILRMVSARLGKWLYSAAYAEYGADYFIDAQDWDRTWVSGISSSVAETKGNRSNLKITLTPKKNADSGFGEHILQLRLVKEGGAWKIDMVNNRKLISRVFRKKRIFVERVTKAYFTSPNK